MIFLGEGSRAIARSGVDGFWAAALGLCTAGLVLGPGLARAQTGAALSATGGVPMGATVVTATRSPSRSDETLSEVVVIDRQALEDHAGRSLAEVLSRLAGLQLSATGGMGKTSSVFLRGTESRHTILLIDGVRYGSVTAGLPIWETLPLSLIERIEVLKGPASALYGSEGVGGVVQVFTRAPRPGFHPEAQATLGQWGHRALAGGASGGDDAWRYALHLQVAREHGFSATNANAPFGNHNPDLDGFSQRAVYALVGWRPNPRWSLDAAVWHSEGKTQFDDGPGRDALTLLRGDTVRVGLRGEPMSGWQSEWLWSQSDDVSDAVRAGFPGEFRSRQTQFTWQNRWQTPVGTVLAGLEHRVQSVGGSTAYVQTERRIPGAFVGLNGGEGRHSWQVNLRHDHNRQFGGASTGFAGYGFALTPAWRLQASHGTSFVMPSFNQLYFPQFGNPLLLPERGRNSEVGVVWTDAGHQVKAVRFDNRIRGYITNTTVPANVPRSRIQGWTLAYSGGQGPWRWRASHDHLDPRNEASGRLLPRRAPHQTLLGADWDQGAWRAGVSAQHTGSRFDDVANTRTLQAYTTVDLHLARRLTPDWTLQTRVINLTDRRYETALGYNQPGRGLQVTLHWQPR